MMAKAPEAPAPSEAAPKTKRVSDPELLAISACARHLDDLTESARCRVMRYLTDKYSPETGPQWEPVGQQDD